MYRKTMTHFYNNFYRLSIATFISSLLSITVYAQTICVYDPMGANGEFSNNFKDLSLAAQNWRMTLSLKPSTNENQIVKDFNTGKCDGMYITSIRARELNNFVGSIDSLGAVQSYLSAEVVIKAFLNPQLAAQMAQGKNEIAGIMPIGLIHLFVNDRKIDSFSALRGKRVIAFENDESEPLIIKNFGAKPVIASISNFSTKFNGGQADVLPAPLIAYKAFELEKGLRASGGIYSTVVGIATGSFVIHKEKFPSTFPAQSRAWFFRKNPVVH